MGAIFLNADRSKRSVVLDLKEDGYGSIRYCLAASRAEPNNVAMKAVRRVVRPCCNISIARTCAVRDPTRPTFTTTKKEIES